MIEGQDMRITRWPQGMPAHTERSRSGDRLQRPDQNLKLSRKLQQGRDGRKDYPGRRSHVVYFQFSLCRLQGPALVMHFSAVHAACVDGIKTVAFGQPVLEAADVALSNIARRPVGSAKLGGVFAAS